MMKSVKKAVMWGPRLNPNAIIKKACTAAICPLTSLLDIPLTANKPKGAKELIKNKYTAIKIHEITTLYTSGAKHIAGIAKIQAYIAVLIGASE